MIDICSERRVVHVLCTPVMVEAAHTFVNLISEVIHRPPMTSISGRVWRQGGLPSWPQHEMSSRPRPLGACRHPDRA